jgi:hypothetical protein
MKGLMRNYKNIATYVAELIQQEKNSINTTSDAIANIINSSIDAYYDMRDLNLTDLKQFANLFVMLENYAQSMIDLSNQYLDKENTSDQFKVVLTSLRKLHSDMLASLIVMRTDLTDTKDFTQ